MRTAIGVLAALTLFAAAVYFVFAHYNQSTTSPELLARATALHEAYARIAPPPRAKVLSRVDIRQEHAISVGASMSAPLGQNEIYADYAGALKGLGWRACNPPSDPNAIPDDAYFEKGPYVAALMFSPNASGQYVFTLTWGIHTC